MTPLKYIKTLSRFMLLIVLPFVVFSSCNSWLDVEPQSDLVEEEFWKKREDIESVLAATYSSMKDLVEPSLIWGELRADMVTLTGDKYGGYIRIAEVDIRPSNDKINWGPYYSTINLANTVLAYSPVIEQLDKSYTTEIKNGIEAEAIFIRSLCYFYLVRVWKDVPLVLSPSSSDTVNFFLPKSTEQVILNRLASDLEDAKNKAFNTQFYDKGPSYFNGRANKYAITALLADIYLWKEDYQKCINNCNELMDLFFYSLLPTDLWFKMFYSENNPAFMKENIFELIFDHTINQNNKIYDDLIKIRGFGAMRFTNRDIFTSSSDIRQIGSKSPSMKYQGRSEKYSRPSEEKDVNTIFYRLGDVYLAKAEALTELNQLSEANNILKQLSLRAGVSFSSILNKQELQKFILDERAREFAMEGKRWFDVLRYAKRNNYENKQAIINMVLSGADIKQQAVLKPRLLDTMSYFLPIPEKEILYNPNLVQNPYYDR